MSRQYRAFLSYSHADARASRRLHSDLERWRVAADLVGRPSAVGVVPADLRPVFRDREDLPGGGQLSDAIRAALSQSMFLVVLCSPHAARSAYVNEEVRYFKGLGRSDRIIPLIVDGEPGDPDRECFPPALMHRIAADGTLTDEPEEPLAADAREHGDGRRRALVKVVAGLLGVPFDEIEKRAARAQRRRTQLLGAVAASMFLLAVAAAGFAWLSETRRVTAENNYQAAVKAADSLLGDIGEELIRVEGVTLDTTRRVIDRAAAIYDDLARALPDAVELKFSRVSALAVFAQALAAKGDHATAIATYERAERLAAELSDELSGYPAGKRLLAMIRWRAGGELASRGDKDAAEDKLSAALAVLRDQRDLFEDDPGLRAELISAATLLGTLKTQRGHHEGAAEALAQAEEMARGLLTAEPDNWRHRLADITVRLAASELQLQRGQLRPAHEALTALALDLRDEVQRQPDFPQLRGMLGVVMRSLGSTSEALGDEPAAQAAREQVSEISRWLAERDAENRGAQRRHADDIIQQAAEQLRDGQIDAAITQFVAGRQILDSQFEQTPDDADLRDSLLLALSTEAYALNQAGYHDAARRPARRLLALREQVLAEQPEAIDAMRGVSLALVELAIALEQRDALLEALALRERSLQLEQRIARVDSEDDRRRTLAAAHQAIGLLNWRLSRRAAAIPHYEQHKELLRSLAVEAGDERRQLEIELGHGLLNLGELRALTGDAEGARRAFAQCLTVRERVLAGGERTWDRLLEMAWAEARFAQFGDGPYDRWKRVRDLLREADVQQPLDDLEEELLTVAHIVLSAGGGG